MRQVPVSGLAFVSRVLAHGGHDGPVGQRERPARRGEGEFRKEVAQGALQKQKSLRLGRLHRNQAGIKPVASG